MLLFILWISAMAYDSSWTPGLLLLSQRPRKCSKPQKYPHRMKLYPHARAKFWHVGVSLLKHNWAGLSWTHSLDGRIGAVWMHHNNRKIYHFSVTRSYNGWSIHNLESIGSLWRGLPIEEVCAKYHVSLDNQHLDIISSVKKPHIPITSLVDICVTMPLDMLTMCWIDYTCYLVDNCMRFDR